MREYDPGHLLTGDRYESFIHLFPGVVRAARLPAGAGKLAGELFRSGTFAKAIVIGGGVQHAWKTTVCPVSTAKLIATWFAM